MVLYAKIFGCLSVTILSLFILGLAVLASEVEPKKASDDEILKIIGADPIATDTNKNLSPNQKKGSLEIDFVRQSTKFKSHTIKSGETLGSISKSYYGDSSKAALIAEFNNIKNKNLINIGQKIKIPVLKHKESEKDKGIKGEDLVESNKIRTTQIETNDLDKRSLLSKLIIILIIILLIGILILLSFKIASIKDSPDIIKIEKVEPFTMGHVDNQSLGNEKVDRIFS